MNWAIFAAIITFLASVALVIAAARSDGARAGKWLAVPLLVVAALNAAAPIRGLVDPGYMGYVFGLLRARMGVEVTVVAGSVFLFALVSAFIAATRRTGPALWIVAGTCSALAVVLGLPFIETALTDPSANIIQLGEYLTIPGMPATLLILSVLMLPLSLGALWAAKAARE